MARNMVSHAEQPEVRLFEAVVSGLTYGFITGLFYSPEVRLFEAVFSVTGLFYKVPPCK